MKSAWFYLVENSKYFIFTLNFLPFILFIHSTEYWVCKIKSALLTGAEICFFGILKMSVDFNLLLFLNFSWLLVIFSLRYLIVATLWWISVINNSNCNPATQGEHRCPTVPVTGTNFPLPGNRSRSYRPLAVRLPQLYDLRPC